MADLIEEFSEGKVQFAYVKVVDPNTGLPKNVLIAWCGEGVPERTKGYFTSHLAAVSKFLHVSSPLSSSCVDMLEVLTSLGIQGYHVQITARADGDLTPEGILQKVGDSSGSKYSSQAGAPSSAAAPPPPTATKPAFTPTRSGGAGFGSVHTPQRTGVPRQDVDDDGWGPDAPPVTRTQLEKVQPAYKPTKVDMQELKSQQQSLPIRKPDGDDVVKGGYQPVGKVDIAAIRRQAREAGELEDDRPAPVKGAYEPVGKVDIAAIRSRAQPPSERAAPPEEPVNSQKANEASPTPEKTISFSPAERLTSLPKPKVGNKFGANAVFPGTKPPLPTGLPQNPNPPAAQIGSASRTFADQGGKTPAQQWAERKAREREASETGPSSTYHAPEPTIHSQHSGGGDWKSSYTGKQWAPVQTTHVAKSMPPENSQQAADFTADEKPEEVTEPAQQSVSSIRDQFNEPARESLPEQKAPDVDRAVPVPGLPTGPTEPEPEYEPETHQAVPSPPQQPRSPTPPTPAVREASPIRVAMPVGRGVADAHDEQHAPPPAMPTESLQQAVPDESNIEDATDMSRATAQATVGEKAPSGGTRALAQYDYEKAEDNEIDLREGEYVTEVEMIDKDWWLGVNTSGERGLFPSNYVEVVESEQPTAAPTQQAEEPAPALAPAPAAAPAPSAANGPTAIALYDYEAAEDNEISFPEGAQIVKIVSRPG